MQLFSQDRRTLHDDRGNQRASGSSLLGPLAITKCRGEDITGHTCGGERSHSRGEMSSEGLTRLGNTHASSHLAENVGKDAGHTAGAEG